MAKRRSTGGRTTNDQELPFQNDVSPIAVSNKNVFSFDETAKQQNSKREHQTILEENSYSLADNTVN